jgi:glycosyltransferase involved in cell wall biosynthesis
MNSSIAATGSNPLSSKRVAFLFPSLELAPYWQPVFQRFTRDNPQTTIYTCFWEGFTPGFEGRFNLQVVGQQRNIDTDRSGSAAGYKKRIMVLPLNLLGRLIKARTQVIFTTAYSMWTLLVLLLKPLFGWKVVILYEGSSPTYDYQDAKLRLVIRRWMTRWADAVITNSPAGQRYLLRAMQAQSDRVFQQPYQVPDPAALLGAASVPLTQATIERPSMEFLFVGRVTARKGIKFLIQACEILKQRGYGNFSLTVAGEGDQREELTEWAVARGLPIRWLGRLPYHEMGRLFQNHDVFVFPTLEDTWGMVLLEAMVFGKPILSSLDAGAAESMVTDGWNGYVIQSKNAENIADRMQQLLENPALIPTMGQRSRDRIAQHTPDDATQFLLDMVERVTAKRSGVQALPLPRMQ